ncbi:MAG: hypothetical protein L0Z62_28435 [Gemmataceae bacterium]|nr:hypothetical protein [Gemmataceae bacterium]
MGEPGWAAAIKPQEESPQASRGSKPPEEELAEVVRALLEALTPYPEARGAAVRALSEQKSAGGESGSGKP